MSDTQPQQPPKHPEGYVGFDLAWLLNTGAVRGEPGRVQGVTFLTGVAGVHDPALVPVTFAGSFTVDLPWVGEPPADGQVVLVAQVDRARVVLGGFATDDVAALDALIAALDTRVTDLETADESSMYVENAAAGLAFYWTGGVVNKTADGSGNCSILFGEPGTPFSYPTATITAWAQGASGGAPIAVNIGAVNIGSLDLHLSGLEGTVVPTNSFDLIYGVLGY